MPRFFSLEEATALLPRLGEIVREMQSKKPQLDALREELGEMTETASGNGHLVENDMRQKRRQAQILVERLNELITELNGMGCELKGVEEGLVDFPAQREGRTVYLCWKLGEDSIDWWHELDTGFSGRKPL